MANVNFCGTKVQFTKQVTDDEVAEAVRTRPDLTLVDLADQELLTDMVIYEIVSNCPLLETLYLVGTHVSSEAIQFAKDNCEHLERVDLPEQEVLRFKPK